MNRASLAALDVGCSEGRVDRMWPGLGITPVGRQHRRRWRRRRPVQAPGLRFAAVQFAHAAIDPHGGPRPCWLAGLAPIGWSAATTPDAAGFGAMWVIDAGRGHWRIDWESSPTL